MYWTYPECSGDAPPPLYGHSSITVDEKIFVFGGGNESNYFNDLYILDSSMLFSIFLLYQPLIFLIYRELFLEKSKNFWSTTNS